jgi:hypothetical protein
VHPLSVRSPFAANDDGAAVPGAVRRQTLAVRLVRARASTDAASRRVRRDCEHKLARPAPLPPPIEIELVEAIQRATAGRAASSS